MIDTKEIELAIKDSIRSKIDNLVSEFDIKTLIARTVDTVIAERVSSSISVHISSLIQKGKLEREVTDKFDSEFKLLIEQEIRNRTANAVARIDIATEVGKHINGYLETRITSAALPKGLISHQAIDWNGFNLPADALSDGTIENFASTGIQDVASQIELTVADGMVVIENSLVSRRAEFKESVIADSIVVNDIKIKNNLILNENINNQFASMIRDGVNRELANRKIDVVGNPIYANGREALTDSSLGPSIVNSNIRKLGRLTELNVAGIAQFGETMVVTDSGKVGINTNEPEGAFTVWDDDSDLTVRRYKKKNMYVGTMRDVDLSFGVNGDVKLALRRDGSVELNHLVINGLRVSVANAVPYEAGQPGEIVIMSNAKINEPWAYRCVNGQWTAMK